MGNPEFMRKQTLAAYETGWDQLSGDPDLRSRFWQEESDRFLAEEELCIASEWFKGKNVLEAGCGGGRWTYALQKLGANVTAFDATAAGSEVVRNTVARGQTRTFQANVFDLAPEITDQRYDLVFTWGVLHHTGDTRRCIQILSELLADDGLLYIYLYGRDTWSRWRRLWVPAMRYLMLPIPATTRFRMFKVMLGEYKAGVAMDVLAPTIAHRHTHDEVDEWLEEAGLRRHLRTIGDTEIRRKAWRNRCSAESAFLPVPEPPYWYDAWTDENYNNLRRRDMYDPGREDADRAD